MSQPSTRAERAANLFDLRRIIGGVFTVWGVLLIILGLTDSVVEENKAAGININLIAGIGMLVLGLVFLAWAFSRPLGTELREAERRRARRLAHACGAARRGRRGAAVRAAAPGGPERPRALRRERGPRERVARAPSRRSRRRPSGRRRLRRA